MEWIFVAKMAGIVAGGLFILLLGVFALIAKFYRKVEQGRALIVSKTKDVLVTFTGATVLPIVHKGEMMDISVKTIEIDRRGKDGLTCQDNIRADIKVTFFVRVGKTREDVLKVAQSIGCARASDQQTLEDLFIAKFSEGLKTVGKRLDFESLYKERDSFRDEIMKVIGEDLNGYSLEDAAIDFLEQTPLESMDPQNILDAQGIRKITQITTQQNVLTNDLIQSERKEITKQNAQADEAVFELERQRADAENKQKREIASVKAREEAETIRVQAEEKSKAQRSNIKAEEEIKVEEENKERQVQVAAKNRERVVAVENERVEKDRVLEAISRERATELERIDKEKALEVQKKAIADVIRDRVSVEKTVAEEEERIKDVRALAEATRLRDVTKLTAEGQAVEQLVLETKAAEAKQISANFAAQEKLTLASADLEVADKEAQAKIRLADGTRAEHAAEGLAIAQVKEADAVATEKHGLAEVRVKEADALAVEKQGLAHVNIKQADAAAVQKMGAADADVIRQKLLAQAEGTEKQGLADAEVTRQNMLAKATGAEEQGMAEMRVREAEAVAIEKKGIAEGVAIEKKLTSEATGLAEKAEAMKQLDGVGREHEEFRLRLEKEKVVDLETLNVRKDVAEAQARILAEAFHQAKINIVGGDGAFFDRFVNAVSLGQSLDGALNNSETLQSVAKEYLDGTANLPSDIKDVLSRPALSAENLQQLTISALLGKMMVGLDQDGKGKIQGLIDKACELGIDTLTTRHG